MGSHGGDAERAGLRHDDGASHAQGISRGAGGRVDDEAVGLVSGQVFAIDFHADGNHGGIVALEHGHFVEREGVAGQTGAFIEHFDDAALVDFVCVVVDVVDALFYFVLGHIGQETEPSHVDAQDGDAFVAHPGGRGQERAVAAHAHGDVGIEVAPGNQPVGAAAETERFRKVIVKSGFDIELGPAGGQQGDELPHRGRFFGLIHVAEKGKFELFCHSTKIN